ncbi:hypothetical protein [Magnetospirillum sulfuroxidans]|uniref:Cytochrome b561 bacterial/Ni-hydrogenase domain-containing protein n=1 Tax=Magnetospirillum sulfuroxidans TaxID=611300 RepID=A0ABS5IEH7_9PROT|nr:hypothetical protein [Magnetospirillum sulfuroxidans]MBR9972815.1 hypothetical protein [Magnetospirillum sulfuroxidans]
MSPKLQYTLIKIWHAWVGGAFLVAYLTADEDTYSMHLFAGYAVLAAIVVRLLAAMVAPAAGPLRLRRPSFGAVTAWFAVRKGRHPLFAWFAAALMIIVGLAALSGALADVFTWLEHPHEAIATASLWVIFGHIGFVVFIYGGKRLLGRIGDAVSHIRLSASAKEHSR